MIIIKNNLLPFKGYKAMNLFGLILTKEVLTEKDKRHEAIHSQQMIELGIVGFALTLIVNVCLFNINILWSLFGFILFYIWYGVEYLFIRKYHKKQNDAYHDISFEEEAYENDDNENYLANREMFAWIKYLKINK